MVSPGSSKPIPVLLVLLLLLGGLRFRIVADIYLIEIYALIYLLRKLLLGNFDSIFTGMRTFYRLIILWMIGIIVSSLLNESSLKSILIAVGSPLILMSLMILLTRLFQEYRTSNVFFLIIAGQVLGSIAQPYNLGIVNGWKFQYGTALGITIIFLIEQKFNRWLIYSSLLLLAYVSIHYESRSLAAFFTLCAFLDLLARRRIDKLKNLHRRPRRVLLIMAPLLVFASYLFLAQKQIFGMHEYLRSSLLIGSPWKLLSGRSEIFYTLPAFLLSPLFGYGADINVDQRFLESVNDWLVRNDVVMQSQLYSPSELPIHSYLMSSLLFGGIISGLFWTYLLLQLFKVITRDSYSISYFVFTSRFLSINLFWNILFSPWGASQRLIAALTIVFIFSQDSKNNVVDPIHK